GVFIGYFSSDVNIDLLLFRGSSPTPVARRRTFIAQSIAPAFWFDVRSGAIPPLLLSLSTQRNPTAATETWSVAVSLTTTGGGFGGGSAFANAFTRVRVLNCF